MKSQTPLTRWGQILIPLIVLTAICVPGVEAMGCRERCGEGTFCSWRRCKCKNGYNGLGTVPGSRVKFCSRQCETGALLCPAKTTCKEVILEGGYSVLLCECSAGSRLLSTGECPDIDECALNRNMCGKNSVCTNTDGSYECTCAEGYKRKDGDKIGCSQDIDECSEKPSVCGNNSVCTNTDGNYTCTCAEGYRQRDDELVGCSQDIDECAGNRNMCGKNSVCTNTDGSYECACSEGYKRKDGDKIGCSQDINECTESPNVCGNNSVCTNTDGNYTCACAEGYRQIEGEEAGCSQDIDECTETPAICGNNSVCKNTEGNYTCACVDGYIQRGNKETGCSQIITGSLRPASTAADSSVMTIGLALGIAGVLLAVIAVVVVVIVVRARNRSRAGAGEDIGLDTQGKRSKVTAHAYENVAGQQQRGENNPSYQVCTVLPDVLSTSAHSRYSTVDRYEELDLPPQTEQGNDPGTLYSLAANIEDWEPNESSKYSDLYSNNEIAGNKREQLAAKKSHVSETSPSDSTYNVLSKPNVEPSAAADNTPDNYNTLCDINLKTTN